MTMLLNELAIQIESLENKYDRLEAALDHARTEEQADLIEYRMSEISELLEAAREDYAAQMEYEGLDDYEYNGLNREDFYEY
jgi:transcription elongation GreA/GreB family factor